MFFPEGHGLTTSGFLVIGGGIIGISIARELKRRFSDFETRKFVEFVLEGDNG